MRLEEAKEFVISSVLSPAMTSDKVSQKVRDVTKSQLPWVTNFKKVGDVYQYLLSTTKSRDSSVDELEAAGLNTYENILPEFKKRFKAELNDTSDFADFTINHQYSAREILSVVGQYDTRSGGIQLHKVGGRLESIAIKVTLTGGKYENEWLIPDQLLKYYMKSINGVFKESYDDNASIIGSANIPIHTFVRQTNKDKKFTYKGNFKYLSHFDENGDKWFQLERASTSSIPSLEDIADNLNTLVDAAITDTSERRKKRLDKAPKKPKARVVTTVVYERNPDVIAEVLQRANGRCEHCNETAPFRKKTTKKPYLEVHHIIRLADGGDDTVENTIALCPNCHREKHYGEI
ncbi:HNH endonuclease [Vibrio parahaemolyticus]